MNTFKAFVCALISSILCATVQAGPNSRLEITDITQAPQGKQKYSQDMTIANDKLDISNVYKWKFRNAKGILITATINSPTAPHECVVLSERNGRVLWIGSSLIYHHCKWTGSQPIMRSTTKGAAVSLENLVDLTGDESIFTPSQINLTFRAKEQGFCMLEEFGENSGACVRFAE